MCQRWKTVYFPPVICSILAVLLLMNPAAAAQGFSDGLQLCIDTVLPALFPFFVISELLLHCPFREKYLHPVAGFFGLNSGRAVLVVLLSWLGGYAVCAGMTASLSRSRAINARDTALIQLLGCCSSPGFVIGCVGGLLLHNLRLGVLLYVLQLAANLIAGIFCLPLLPKVSSVPHSLSDSSPVPSLSQAIGAAVQSSLSIVGCIVFFRTISGVILLLLPHDTFTAPLVNGFLEVSSGCAEFAALGGKWALYGCCACLSLLGLSVWAQLSMLLQGTVSLRLLAVHRILHMISLWALVWCTARLLPGTMTVYRTMAQRVILTRRLPLDAAIVVLLFLCAALYKVKQNFYNK